MVHLSEEALSELLDGGRVAGAEEHMGSCALCRAELEALRQLRTDLRELPELQPPAELWSHIAAGLPASRPRRGRLRGPSLIALQAAAMAAVFVIGLGLGRVLQPGDSPSPAAGPDLAVVEESAPTSLAAAMAEVRERGSDYDRALRNLQRLAQQQGAPAPSLSRERLASLDALVEASRTALSADPADPVLNSYLFAALDERDAVMQEMSASGGSGAEVMWR